MCFPFHMVKGKEGFQSASLPPMWRRFYLTQGHTHLSTCKSCLLLILALFFGFFSGFFGFHLS